MESMLRKLRYQATAAGRERTLQHIFNAMAECQEPAPAARRVQIGRIISELSHFSVKVMRLWRERR